MKKETNPRGKKITNALAKQMQKKWQESKMVSQMKLPNGFFLDKESLEFLLTQSKEVDGIAVTFGVDEENKMAATVYAVNEELKPVKTSQSLPKEKSSETDESSFVVYDRYGTCCPK